MKKLINLLLMFSLLSFSSSLLAGKLYKWTDKNGNVHFSQTEPPQNKIKKIDTMHIKTHTPNKKDVQRAENSSRKYKRQKERDKRDKYYKKRNEEYQERNDKYAEDREKRQIEQKEKYEQAAKDRCNKTRETYCNKGSAYIRKKAIERARKLNDKRTIRYK